MTESLERVRTVAGQTVVVLAMFLLFPSPKGLANSGNEIACLGVQNERLVSLSLPELRFPATACLQIPARFELPSSKEAWGIHDELLANLNGNPGRRERFFQVVYPDWDDLGRDFILVGELGSLYARQGRVTQDDWDKIRDQIRKSELPETREKIEQQRRRIREGRSIPVPNEVIHGEVAVVGDHDFIIFAQVEFSSGGRTAIQRIARKVMYSDGYVVFVEIALDGKEASSEDQLLIDLDHMCFGIR